MSRGDHLTTTPFETDDLVTAAFVWCQGHQPTRTKRTGTFCLFMRRGNA